MDMGDASRLMIGSFLPFDAGMSLAEMTVFLLLSLAYLAEACPSPLRLYSEPEPLIGETLLSFFNGLTKVS